MAKVSTDRAEHYTWGNACGGWHFVNQPSLSVIRERMPPGTAEVRHLHKTARQFFFVLAGIALALGLLVACTPKPVRARKLTM